MSTDSTPALPCSVCGTRSPEGLAVSAHVVGAIVAYICAGCAPWGERAGLFTTFILSMRARYPDVEFRYYPLPPPTHRPGATPVTEPEGAI